MRAVVDTNVLIAALLWRGTPHALLERVRAGTLDKDLLALGRFDGIPIVLPAEDAAY